MGIDPISYKPWTGERTSYYERIFIMSKTIFRDKLRSKWVLALFILGIFFIYGISIIFYVIMPHQELRARDMVDLLKTGTSIFLLLLVSMVASDTISEDLRNNSFVLYFSKAIKPESYLLGKGGGVFMALSMFSLIPPSILALAIMATQSSSNYGDSMVVLAKTVFAGVVTTAYFIPYGLFISSLTNRKSYAAVGTFMSFIVMSIVASIFSQFNSDWGLLDPINVLYHFYDVLYDIETSGTVNSGLAAAIFIAFFTAPLVLVYIRVRFKAEGR